MYMLYPLYMFFRRSAAVNADSDSAARHGGSICIASRCPTASGLLLPEVVLLPPLPSAIRKLNTGTGDKEKTMDRVAEPRAPQRLAPPPSLANVSPTAHWLNVRRYSYPSAPHRPTSSASSHSVLRAPPPSRGSGGWDEIHGRSVLVRFDVSGQLRVGED
ncbi:hypothetical protein MSAN_01365900 [Mycena sanguinolenta]|uniref:Uncharacterized protein n=1 Tax=Mycena sanguinolenta TaxID=230812 RepID=A0A8H7CXU2_9AGAR|nr:hypothetical protein MSAN_01365900 [Mycena sanguinolenta]